MSGRVLWQGADPWGRATIGTSTTTIGKAGCLLTAIAMACRHLGVDKEATPLTVQAHAGGGAFVGANAIIPKVASANGLVCGDFVPVTDSAHGLEWAAGLLADGVGAGAVLLHVDHDEDRGGDHDGDHWVLAVGIIVDVTAAEVVYLDSATAAEGRLSLATLSGQSSWAGQLRTYKVRGMRTLKKA